RTNSWIALHAASRWRALSFLESPNLSAGKWSAKLKSDGNTTAAATIGPASGPRPTSSRPQINFFAMCVELHVIIRDHAPFYHFLRHTTAIMRLALVHDWLNQVGGAEDVLTALVGLYPESPLYTSIYWREGMPTAWQKWPIHNLWMDKLPG